MLFLLWNLRKMTRNEWKILIVDQVLEKINIQTQTNVENYLNFNKLELE